MITNRSGCMPGSHAITLNVGVVGQFGWTNGSRRTCNPGIALYWLNRKSRAELTPCPGCGWSEQDWRVRKFWSVCAVLKMLLALTLLMIALISGSVVMLLVGAKPASATAMRITSSKLPLISLSFMAVSFAGEIRDRSFRNRHALADTERCRLRSRGCAGCFS